MYRIRKYRPSDRERLRYIAKETAWKSYKKNDRRKETVALMYNDYFTEYESEHIFVAVNEADIPVGYVICSTDYEQFVRKSNHELLPKAMKLYPPLGAVHWMLLITLKAIKRPACRVHLHIDLLPEAQRCGLGTRLLDALSHHLYEKGIGYMAVCGVNKHAGSYRFYQKYGFATIKNHSFGRATMGIHAKEKHYG